MCRWRDKRWRDRRGVGMEDEGMRGRWRDGGEGEIRDRGMGGRWRDRRRWKEGLFGREGK